MFRGLCLFLAGISSWALALDRATFAGGCFWCMEPPFEKVAGVKDAVSGYAGGTKDKPKYEEVSAGTTGHTESVQVIYDSKIVSYEKLLEVFWRSMDPTDSAGQFVDRGTQYRPAIFYENKKQKIAAEKSMAELQKSGKFKKPIVVEITKLMKFFPAEDYHQDFYKKNSVRYHEYRAHSGRDAFLDNVWGKDGH